MAFKLFPFSKSYLGIDIGSSAIRVVEIERKAGKKLKNYGELSSEYFSNQPFRRKEKGNLLFSDANISAALSSILKEAGIKEKRAFFSIPDFATFFTTFNLPPMSQEEIPNAVKYEAPRRIPLPLSEVTLDWEVVKGTPSLGGKTSLKIILVAVPNDLISHYQNIAQSLGLDLLALEAEVFALSRALIKFQDKESTVCLVDVGKKTTTINIISRNILRDSHSLDIAGDTLTANLANALGIDFARAEVIKRSYGIKDDQPIIKGILLPSIKSIVSEMKDIFAKFYLGERSSVKKVIISGETAWMPGLVEYFRSQFNLPIEIANPFFGLSYPPTLEPILKKIGPGFTIAIGVALREVK